MSSSRPPPAQARAGRGPRETRTLSAPRPRAPRRPGSAARARGPPRSLRRSTSSSLIFNRSRPPFSAGLEGLAGQVGDHPAIVGPQIGGQTAVEIPGQHPLMMRPGQQHDVGVEAGGQCHPVQLVDLVSLEAGAARLGERGSGFLLADRGRRRRWSRGRRRFVPPLPHPRFGALAPTRTRLRTGRTGSPWRPARPPSETPRIPGRRRADGPPARLPAPPSTVTVSRGDGARTATVHRRRSIGLTAAA